MVCVRETHPIGSRGSVDVVNEIVRLPTSEPSEPELLVSGPDFLACLRVSPDGEQLCWIDWDHPRMPWDGTRLVVRDLATGTDVYVAGGEHEAITEPTWQADGSIWFLSDRTGWFGIYRWDPADHPTTALHRHRRVQGKPLPARPPP